MDVPRILLTLAYGLTFVIVVAVCSCVGAGGDEAEVGNRPLVDLGKRIFEDPGLSADGSVSCASCHQATRQFTDGRRTSTGVRGQNGTRNAPSLLDAKLVPAFFWDGRETRLERVVMQPFTNSVEMALPGHDVLVQRLYANSAYAQLFQHAFGSRHVDVGRVSASLTAYLRSLPVATSRYDRYVESGEKEGLSDEEIAGLTLFKGKAACADCHRTESIPATFTDDSFHHTGIGFERIAGNVTAMVRELDAVQERGLPIGNAIISTQNIAELGRFASTRHASDLGAFRTPSLRNVALTAPYMHDGSVSTLSQAVEREIYYRSLARNHPITLTVEQQKQLLAFLRALSAKPTTDATSVDGTSN